MDMQYRIKYGDGMTRATKFALLYAASVDTIAFCYAAWMYCNLPQYPILVPICAVIFPFLISFYGWWSFIERRNASWKRGAVLGFLCGWSILASGFLGWLLDAVTTGNTGFQGGGDVASSLFFVIAEGPLLLFIMLGWLPVLISLLIGALLAKHRSRNQ